MSKFLGPIHHWLYNKIQLQEELIDSVLEQNEKNGWVPGLADFVDENVGTVERRPLEEIIDEGNIHGWLQGRISISEARLATTVTRLLEDDPSRLAELQDAAYRMGSSHPLPEGATASEGFKALNDCLLDGMPCDQVNQVIEETPDHVTWKKRMDLHAPYWEDAGGSVKNYDAIRSKLTEGIMNSSGLTYGTLEDDTFEIRQQ